MQYDSQLKNKKPADGSWKRNVVLIAKNANVWLVQLRKKYQQEITHLDQIPEEELERLADWGINALWLIGVWERSPASRRIKELYGKQDMAASAYSIKEYKISQSLGGDEAADQLQTVCSRHSIRLCADIVPNHTGIDSNWLLNHPDWYISVPQSPIPDFHFNSPDLSPDPAISLKLEEGYYNQTGAAEVFLHEDHRSGVKSYIYHGNDGTSMPWNDTAQLNYLNAEVREHMIETILAILKRFPLIRFDAAMTLSKKQFQRLWYPLPNSEERCIPTREKNTMPAENFDRAMPREFWREVIERVEVENPEALLMAEAFWYMENFFIQKLGMHRVYNIAFMQSLRDEDNSTYQHILQTTLETDPGLLEKYVNFLSNPDERTTLDQFGKGEKYFAACTMLATLPGVPMFNHGQIEGFSERYGMDFLVPFMNEREDDQLIQQHEKFIFPLLRKRDYFSNAGTFHLFEVLDEKNKPLSDVYVYFNQFQEHRSLVVVNSSSQEQMVHFHHSCPQLIDKKKKEFSLLELLPASSAGSSLICEEMRTGEKRVFLRKALEKDGLSFPLQPYQHWVFELTWSEGQEDSAAVSH